MDALRKSIQTNRSREQVTPESVQLGVVPGVAPGTVTTIAEIARLAALAESVGLERVGTGDHLIWNTPVFDPIVTMSAMACATSTITLTSTVLILPLRDPLHVAQSYCSLDHLSGGRVELGVGVGGEGTAEFEALGVDITTRGKRANEALEIIRSIWENESTTFSGEFYNVRDVALNPRPIRQPAPPIVIGGRSTAALRRAARLGDRWDGIFLSPKSYARRRSELMELAQEQGRDVNSGLVIWGSLGERHAAERRLEAALGTTYRVEFEKFASSVCCGPPETVAEEIQAFVDNGARVVSVIPIGRAEEQIEGFASVGSMLSN
jgi:probable F420-dependent oxidoreductase